MKEEIYRNIIKNSKIAYLIIDCKKNYHNKYTSIGVIEQSKEFEKVFKILTKNNILDSDITELIINNWINKKFKDNKFNEFVEEIKNKGEKKLQYPSDVDGKNTVVNIYYLNEYFILIFNMDYDLEDNKLKLDFFVNISHELRTPVNLISSTIQLIKLNLKNLSKEDENIISKYIDIMESNSMRLIRLINNLIDSTKIDSGFVKFTPINADIIKFVEDVCDSVVDYVDFNKMNLIFDTDREEEIVLFDPDIIERILLNLLSNAVKFNKVDGTIYVNLYTKDDEIRITVRDEGIGIPKEKLSSIFKRFEQIQTKNKIEKQGSGIGLYLVKSLVTLHGGNIKVESKVNEGSKFIVTIPKKVLENGEELVIDEKEKANRKVNIEFSDI
ncbi:MAG: HAMP domain-containing sensor histidine kinase [Clostridiales bacterium]|uniref:sensor histidine kinase n=1 Tax=Terrisporobacter sp. TaxID=1965305 RepID=UPI002A530120|nr:HAMP domain-containing sensor histidine kinase [Terrisporobacter sp.]MDD7753941.1 HAMP domain-containing sensor histidine kinase [Clostridiales bacterium]MDY4134043.1 HAMP domain-containing sensor histidine kinase [Terrisporobacter sp.]